MVRSDERVYLIDANLLALLAVGATSLDLIAKHKKTKAFSIDDYASLLRLIGSTPILIVPNVATETSNLVAYHEEPERHRIFLTLRRMLDSYRETYVASAVAAAQPEFRFLGLTDAAILAGGEGVEILSADANLCIAAQKCGLRAINFNHLRDGI